MPRTVRIRFHGALRFPRATAHGRGRRRERPVDDRAGCQRGGRWPAQAGRVPAPHGRPSSRFGHRPWRPRRTVLRPGKDRLVAAAGGYGRPKACCSATVPRARSPESLPAPCCTGKARCGAAGSRKGWPFPRRKGVASTRCRPPRCHSRRPCRSPSDRGRLRKSPESAGGNGCELFRRAETRVPAAGELRVRDRGCAGCRRRKS
ncbi:MAG: hypothetical protein AW09_003465 [Candidatus Accumulibacter phosphatis]|uniref:Uncharacterized protein n=1 Tax=Candidatus Accumulibacter phosphatis TaxID=327160 RepID=A0A080LSL3_9PROT|nr:MAG: hypothetical protein AW09_003465 [Candidatus Accumulibacter phosphatis]